ncbi:hypothetical protein BDZ97DRAFT_784500 [Flammula alnicola]|nr:hypothetical protein BDZ97DRAFT_784500 [Flammula alnicola]
MTMKSYTLNNWDGKFAKPVENTAQTTQTHPNGSTRLDLDAQPETSSNYDKNPLIDAQGTGRNVSKEIIHGWRGNLTDDTLNEVRPLIDPEINRRTITPAKEPLLSAGKKAGQVMGSGWPEIWNNDASKEVQPMISPDVNGSMATLDVSLLLAVPQNAGKEVGQEIMGGLMGNFVVCGTFLPSIISCSF